MIELGLIIIKINHAALSWLILREYRRFQQMLWYLSQVRTSADTSVMSKALMFFILSLVDYDQPDRQRRNRRRKNRQRGGGNTASGTETDGGGSSYRDRNHGPRPGKGGPKGYQDRVSVMPSDIDRSSSGPAMSTVNGGAGDRPIKGDSGPKDMRDGRPPRDNRPRGVNSNNSSLGPTGSQQSKVSGSHQSGGSDSDSKINKSKMNNSAKAKEHNNLINGE